MPLIRVNSLVAKGGELTVSYEPLHPRLLDRWARGLIERCLLVELLEGRDRPHTRLVYYKNEKTQSVSSQTFPEA
jgi:hypothetical protein